ncbi:MAG: DegT/DnrJ/EryC1/StrS family aminotransferase [Anaerolineae bacterium]
MAYQSKGQIALEGGDPVRDAFLPFGEPCIGDEEIAEIVDTLRSKWIGTGPKTQRFEEAFRNYIGADCAVAVSSCTAALHLSLIAAGIGEGDEVITTPMTFSSTVNVIVHEDAVPVFVDIDRTTLNIDPALIEERITPRTRAIIPVHFGGLACDMDAILDIARRHEITVIEDAAHAVATKYRGRMIGTLGDFTCFSFYANKNLTTAEGGMITTSNPDAAHMMEIYRLHGMDRDAWKRYQTKKVMLSEAIYPGYKYNMTDMQASLGIHQLKKLERFQEVREDYAAMYDQVFENMPEVTLQPRPVTEGDRHALHLYVLILNTERLRVGRDEILLALRAENIGAAIHYKAIHLHPYYRAHFGYKGGEFPHAEYVSDRILSLPLTPTMSLQDAEDVVRAVQKVIAHYRR